ncbi:MAG TPA: hypothetical protein VNU68_25155 [Verrucomicrobiae bacterium]|nr:hypothetical protein [Verrucomicrobiae bacterium]
MTKKLFILVLAVLTVIAATIGFRRSAPPIFLEANSARYRVISAQYMAGTNINLPLEGSVAALRRRLCEVVGIFVKGFRTNWVVPDNVQRHEFCFLCEGQYPTNNELTEIMLATDAECIDDAGRSLRIMGVGSIARNDDRFWVVWGIPAITETALWPATNFSPRQFRLRQKSDGHEIIRVNVPRSE